MSEFDITSEVSQLSDNPVESQSRHRGAYRTAWGNTWWSMIQRNGQRIYLGTFPTPEEATAAYDQARVRLG
jgi:hypothetical protein